MTYLRYETENRIDRLSVNPIPDCLSSLSSSPVFPMTSISKASMARSPLACIVGAYEHPTRKAPDKSLAQLHAEAAAGALADANLTFDDVDGYFCAGDAPRMGPQALMAPLSMIDYLNLKVRHVDSTDTGGASYLTHLSHAAQAIRSGKCRVALITLAGKPRSEKLSFGVSAQQRDPNQVDTQWEAPFSLTNAAGYAMVARRHMHDFGTTSEQLAWIRVAASTHAQHNPNAMLRNVVSVRDVLDSPTIASPLRRLDCCVVSDGGGALVVVSPEIAREIKRPIVKLIASGEAAYHGYGGDVDLTRTSLAPAGRDAFAEARVSPCDINYASIYDSFTITVLIQLEDLGFCAKGQGGRFVSDGNLISGVGKLPFNTDGGGLCNNHPANRGGMTKIIEAVRQLRGEAHPAVQVKNCALALASGNGGMLGVRSGGAVVILERE